MVENLPTMWEAQVRSLDQEDSLENGMATHVSILSWRIQWAEESGRPQFTGSRRIGHDRATNTLALVCL